MLARSGFKSYVNAGCAACVDGATRTLITWPGPIDEGLLQAVSCSYRAAVDQAADI
jgi:hypothetical protein